MSEVSAARDTPAPRRLSVDRSVTVSAVAPDAPADGVAVTNALVASDGNELLAAALTLALTLTQPLLLQLKLTDTLALVLALALAVAANVASGDRNADAEDIFASVLGVRLGVAEADEATEPTGLGVDALEVVSEIVRLGVRLDVGDATTKLVELPELEGVIDNASATEAVAEALGVMLESNVDGFIVADGLRDHD